MGSSVRFRKSLDWFKQTGQVRVAKRVGVVVKEGKRVKA